MNLHKAFVAAVFWSTIALTLPATAVGQAVKASGQAEWDKTVEAAKREGKVVVSVPTSDELRKEFEAGFQKKFSAIELE